MLGRGGKVPSPRTCPPAPQHPWLPAGAYLESRCFRCLTPLLDLGTEGPRGNVLAMVPCLTKPLEPAGAPEDGTFPRCTLRYFPRTIQHTLQVGCATLAPAPSEEFLALLSSFPVSPSGHGPAVGRWQDTAPAASCWQPELCCRPRPWHGLSLPLGLGWGSRGAQGGGPSAQPLLPSAVGPR